MREMFAVQSTAKGLEYIEEVSPELRATKVTSDYGRIRTVLINVLQNSVKYTNRGKISFKAELQDLFLVLTVNDTGIGISEAN